MSWTQTPRERYKGRYKSADELNRAADADVPETGREKLLEALCVGWETSRGYGRRNPIVRQLSKIANTYPETLCESLVALLGTDKQTDSLCLTLVSEQCTSQSMERFVELFPVEPEATRHLLAKLFSTLNGSRKSSGTMKSYTLTIMASMVNSYHLLTAKEWDEILSMLMPELTPSEARCITLAHSRPDLAGIAADRLAAGEVTDEMLRIIVSNPAAVLREGSL